ncbi:avidin/streptavidin family protein [Serratia sp. 2723]|uniref:avidin/streptavidin family protein n=1 Tax=unclassified Serratia (in: enterobacteria) TaxID=2647522 RepID=UPI003D1B01F5
MLNNFLVEKKLITTAAPGVNFDGKWRNELNSEMELKINANGAVSGKYKTGVGAPGKTEEFELTGFTSGDLLSFTVNFGNYGSLTSWAGQLTTEGGVEVIKTMWLLARNIKDADEPESIWGAILTGYDNFKR